MAPVRDDRISLSSFIYDFNGFTVISPVETDAGSIDSWGGALIGRHLSDNGKLVVSGWAIDHSVGQPALGVMLVKEGRILAYSGVGQKRQDVGKAYSNENLELSGWNIEALGQEIGLGSAELEVYARMCDEKSLVKLGQKQIEVSPQVKTASPEVPDCDTVAMRHLLRDRMQWPKMSCDEVSLVDDRLKLRGWALSPVGIKRLKVYIDDKFIAPCFYGYSRLDVKRAYPFVPFSEFSGFELAIAINSAKINEKSVLRFLVIDSDGYTTDSPVPLIMEAINCPEFENDPEKIVQMITETSANPSLCDANVQYRS
ncbi:MAG: hypothetical protein ACYDHG_13630 [Desulfomonilaceae bacterium]